MNTLSLAQQLSSTESILSGAVIGTGATVITGRENYRCYYGTIAAQVPIDGQLQTTNNTVIYRISARSDTAAQVMRLTPTHGELGMLQRFRYNAEVSSELAGLNRKYTNFSPRFEYGDLSGLVARLSQGLQTYSLFGALSFEQLRGPNQATIRALGTLDDPIQATPSALFLPRSSTIESANATFSAIVAAATACGCTVVTDVLAVNQNNAPQLLVFDNADLAVGIVHALRILVHMMNMCGAGAEAALALTVGAHMAGTVVGHTDEGAYTRDVLREVRFAVPHGGVVGAGWEKYGGLPVPNRSSFSTFTTLGDSILLTTAAAVAIADPLVTFHGNKFPTVVTTDTVDVGNGTSQEGNLDCQVSIASKIAACAGEFPLQYAKLLCRIMSVGEEHAAEAAAVLTQAIGSLATRGTRHTRFTVVAPFYWIEPTPLFKRDIAPDMAANAEGYGQLCAVEMQREMGYFEKVEVKQRSTNATAMAVKFKSARLCGMILFHQNNARDGLANFVIRGMTGESMMMRGGVNEQPFTSVLANRDMGDYVWQRGDGGVPAPAEMCYTEPRGMTIIAKNCSMNMQTFQLRSNFLVKENIDTAKVRLTCQTPSFWMCGALNDRPRRVIRSRNAAAIALDSIRYHSMVGHMTGGEYFAHVNAPPVWYGSDPATDVSPANVERIEPTTQARNAVRVTTVPAERVSLMTPLNVPVLARVAGVQVAERRMGRVGAAANAADAAVGMLDAVANAAGGDRMPRAELDLAMVQDGGAGELPPPAI
jgi:hypothetical protein